MNSWKMKMNKIKDVMKQESFFIGLGIAMLAATWFVMYIMATLASQM